jgi:hypothetical protein
MVTKKPTSVADLIAKKNASAHTPDGALEVALSIAAVTDLVRVDATTTPFSTTPDDLFDLTFNDNKVGIDDSQMNIFKANLAVQLPEIKTDINNIPENSQEKIGDVAEFIRLSLLQASQTGGK